MPSLFALVFGLGLVLGVFGMLRGIERGDLRPRLVFNLPTVAALAAFFGLSGYLITRNTTLAPAVTIVLAAVAALIGASGMFALIAGWAVPSARRDVEDERYTLQGCFGRVTRAIRADQDGEIAYQQAGERRVAGARSLDGRAIPADSEVVIERIEEGVAYVELWSKIEKQLELPH